MYEMSRVEQTALRVEALQPQIPAWAKLEKMEISTPEAALWKLSDGSGWGVAFRLCRRMKCFFQWLRSEKH